MSGDGQFAAWKDAVVFTDLDDDFTIAIVRESPSPGLWCVEVSVGDDPLEDLAHSKQEGIDMVLAYLAENDLDPNDEGDEG